MRMDKLTSKFQIALSDAQSLALGRDNNFIEPEHVMKAMLDQQGGSIRPLLKLPNCAPTSTRLWMPWLKYPERMATSSHPTH